MIYDLNILCMNVIVSKHQIIPISKYKRNIVFNIKILFANKIGFNFHILIM